MKPLSKDSFHYRRLKNLFPELEDFQYTYDDGDYYNTAKTYFYDKAGKQIDVEDHKVYG